MPTASVASNAEQGLGEVMCWQAAQSLSGIAHPPASARTFVCEHLDALLEVDSRPQVTDDAALVVSELVTNAVQAGSSFIGLSVELHHGELRLEVTDDGAGWPMLQHPDPGADHGRGLLLVAAAARGWGVELVGERRKVVWALLIVPRTLTPSLLCSLR
jgi:anti-sigma regulatory factor (Ser/Thr protein kinase)